MTRTTQGLISSSRRAAIRGLGFRRVNPGLEGADVAAQIFCCSAVPPEAALAVEVLVTVDGSQQLFDQWVPRSTNGGVPLAGRHGLVDGQEDVVDCDGESRCHRAGVGDANRVCAGSGGFTVDCCGNRGEVD